MLHSHPMKRASATKPSGFRLLSLALLTTVAIAATAGIYLVVGGDESERTTASVDSSTGVSSFSDASGATASAGASSLNLGAPTDALPMALGAYTITYQVDRVDDIGEHSATLQMEYRTSSDWVSTVVDSSDKAEIGSSRTYDGETLLSFDARMGISHQAEVPGLLPTDGFYHPQLEFLLGLGTELTLADAAGQLAFRPEDIIRLTEATALAPLGAVVLTRFTSDGEEVMEEYTYDLKTGLLLSRVTTVNGELLERIDAISYSAE